MADIVTDITQSIAASKALEQAIFIVDGARMQSAGESYYAWDKNYRIGEYLRLQRVEAEKAVRDYFADPEIAPESILEGA